MEKTFQIIISGQVQGVGFRPFVYGLAHQYRLKGMVCNNENGVLIHINASEERATEFLHALLQKAPAISVIQSHSLSELPLRSYSDFRILPSESKHQINIPLTPDFVICESCKSEIRNTSHRRFGYAFTTCTHCGPRYAITTKFPFERANTTMSEFHMCTQCETEYTDADDRRFHSQTNSCAECGIQLRLTTADGIPIATDTPGIIKKVSGLILSGNIVALKNTNGYLLCCDANNKTAIGCLREKKQRPNKPFALLYPSLEKIKKDFELGTAEEKALTSSAGPIVILNPKKNISDLALGAIAPGLDQLGAMLASSALLTLLMDALKIPIIATSGNIHGSPIICEAEDAIQKLSGVADYFVHHNLNISFPQDDSVVRFAGEQRITLRRSRGLAPNYLKSPLSGNQKVLAMGAHLKSTFGFVPNTHTYVSPYFGNLDSYEVSQRYQESITKFTSLFETRPEVVLIDAHPQYQSSIMGKELADKWKAELYPIQHHKAHFASVLGEHRLFETEEKILGTVWDGTGLGDDGAIWGGEFFVFENGRIERLAHFEYVDWIAADKMAKEPRLSLLCMLPESEREVVRHKFSETEWKVYNTMLKKNTLKTSSVGRLFDAVASLLDLGDTTSYEGEAAMLLENEAKNYLGSDSIDFLEGRSYQNIPTRILTTNILKAKTAGLAKSQIAHGFIHTLALSILKTARQNHCGTIACSGGVFQNSVLVEKLSQLAQKQGIKLKFNRILSSNDENISFGQLCYHQYIKN
ncbi:carbamoyltransferase HypF [Zobellia galactanivorans]|uniref:carbamoyltransferase HypF n=1 Tax=Zobellia galactanivorans (strain DSM 12802 / CCUG 47099 / CIP 106680 / NCIMB 13871 / Dsij) TaxID=63186 RepID=UPI0026E3C468|nr:carbamoyltransferase HypF [Zobellia galactanivorans]MDO6811083.1 carbamoyltransferase HypF [Zobellia galactanivorans]